MLNPLSERCARSLSRFGSISARFMDRFDVKCKDVIDFSYTKTIRTKCKDVKDVI